MKILVSLIKRKLERQIGYLDTALFTNINCNASEIVPPLCVASPRSMVQLPWFFPIRELTKPGNRPSGESGVRNSERVKDETDRNRCSQIQRRRNCVSNRAADDRRGFTRVTKCLDPRLRVRY